MVQKVLISFSFPVRLLRHVRYRTAPETGKKDEFFSINLINAASDFLISWGISKSTVILLYERINKINEKTGKIEKNKSNIKIKY
jgi:hypothetical protein